MSFFGLIGLVVVAVFLVRQNNRIGRLEKLMEGATIPSVRSTAPTIPTIPTQTVSQTITPPSVDTATISAVPLSSKITSHESEEASGRFLGKLGIAALIIGVAFFLKYAFDNNWVGPTGRVMIGILAGFVLLGLGQFLRRKYLVYSDLLMGGGIGVLYLSVYSAYSFYGLIDALPAGMFMLAVTALAFAISIVNATITLSVVGIIGGFATPFLIGGPDSDMGQLFAYLTILNIGVLAVSLFKRWPQLLAVALSGTILNFTVWFLAFYTDDKLASTIIFLFISFLIFLTASLSRIIATGTKANASDYFLLAINAIWIACMGYIILEPLFSSVLGFAAVLVALVYIGVAYVANVYNPGDRALNIFLPGLAVTFLSLAVPLQLSGPWIAMAWIIEACFLYVIALVINNRGFQVMGLIVYAIGILAGLVYSLDRYDLSDFVPVFNQSFFIIALGVVAAYVIAYIYKQYGSTTLEIQKRGVAFFVILANILTVYVCSMEIHSYYRAEMQEITAEYEREQAEMAAYNDNYYGNPGSAGVSGEYYERLSSAKNWSNTAISIFWALYAALLIAIGFAKRTPGIRRLGLILFVITAVKVVVDVWSLGQLYRIISFIAFGVVALIASFAYAKYKDRLKEIV